MHVIVWIHCVHFVYIFLFIVAWWFGDPHIVTLDGHKYTFNGKGDYILISTEDNSFTLHGRMEEAGMVNDTGAGGGTVFTALAARQGDSDTVQFELGEQLLLRVNGMVDTFNGLDEKTYTNVVVQRKGNNSFSAVFSSGVYIEVRAVTQSNLSPYFSVAIVSMPVSYQGQTRGLMGNYNGDTADDLVPQTGGDPLPLNSTLSALHWNFGVTCRFIQHCNVQHAMICTCTHTSITNTRAHYSVHTSNTSQICTYDMP